MGIFCLNNADELCKMIIVQRCSFVIGLLIVSYMHAYPQNRVRVSGAVCDSVTRKPLMFSTITFKNESGQLYGVSADELGEFAIVLLLRMQLGLLPRFCLQVRKHLRVSSICTIITSVSTTTPTAL